MDDTIDTSEIPENLSGFHRLRRDDRANLPKRRSLIRDAIKQELKSRKMTPYRLWKEAVHHCPTISQSAVYEFIKGDRQLELPYAEALMAAVKLGVARLETDEAKRPRKG